MRGGNILDSRYPFGGKTGPPPHTFATKSAWECPRCQRINAWFVRHCDCPPRPGTVRQQTTW